MKVVSWSEWRIALGIALAVAIILQVPYVIGYLNARPGMEYTGLLINLEDGSYLSAIDKGIAGAWLYQIPFTTEPHAPVLIEVFYLALGHLARLLGLSATAMWHCARSATAVLMFSGLFLFICVFLRDPRQRWIAYLWAIFGAGFDWQWFPWEQVDYLSAAPLDWRMPEAHLFFGSMTYPHYAMNIGLILWVLGALWYALAGEMPDRRRWILAVVAALGNLLLGVVYPFLIFLTASVASASYLYLVWRARKILWRQAGLVFLAFVIPLPLFVYYQTVLLTNEVFQIWNAQAVTFSPNPLHYFLAYAPYLICGVLTFKLVRQPGHSRLVFLWIWAGVVAGLLYAPLNAQRRFVLGLQVPLVILATAGLGEVLLPWLAKTRVFVASSRLPNYSNAGLQKLVTVFLISITSLANGYVWVSSVVLLGWEQPYPLFRPVAELRAMDWLRANTTPQDVVLSSYWTGSFIPARAGNTVFVGQRYETIRFDDKRAAAEKFFAAHGDDAWRKKLLHDYRIAFVFWGRSERDLGTFEPEQASYLERVYLNQDAQIFRVRDNKLGANQ